MGNKEMPNNGLKRFRMGRNIVWVYGRNNDAGVSLGGRIAAVFADDSDDTCPYLFRQLNGRNETRGNILFQIAATHGKDEQGVFAVEVRATEPLDEDAGPTLIVGAGGEFGDIIGRRITFQAGDLAEIIYGMRGVGRAPADPQNEKPTPTGADVNEFGDTFFAVGRIDLGDYLAGFLEMLNGIGHKD